MPALAQTVHTPQRKEKAKQLAPSSLQGDHNGSQDPQNTQYSPADP